MLLRGVLMFQHLRFKFCSRNRKLRRRSLSRLFISSSTRAHLITAHGDLQSGFISPRATLEARSSYQVKDAANLCFLKTLCPTTNQLQAHGSHCQVYAQSDSMDFGFVATITGDCQLQCISCPGNINDIKNLCAINTC